VSPEEDRGICWSSSFSLSLNAKRKPEVQEKTGNAQAKA
jgi:hypothetical protein